MVVKSLILVHGEGSGPWIWTGWGQAFEGVSVSAVDLHAAVDAASASMGDYARTVARACRETPRPVGICGWSMGGLVALMAAAEARPAVLVLLEPSPPAEVQGVDPAVELTTGTFDPEAVYGPFPLSTPSRPESLLARLERKRGISVPGIPCPSLVVYGRDFPEERGRSVAELYGSAQLSFPDLDHWGLLNDGRVRRSIATFLAARRPAVVPPDVTWTAESGGSPG